jgi:hypothetical protein
MAIVAGVDFGTLSVRGSTMDSERTSVFTCDLKLVLNPAICRREWHRSKTLRLMLFVAHPLRVL